MPEGPQAISVIERMVHRQLGPVGRELVALAADLAGLRDAAGRSAPDAWSEADVIELRRLVALGVCGVLPEERERPQPLEVDLDVEADLGPAGPATTLDDTVDYGAVCEVVERVVTTEHFGLLERLAARLAEVVLADERVEAVTVAVRKLRPPVPQQLATAGVRITRRRAGDGDRDPRLPRAGLEPRRSGARHLAEAVDARSTGVVAVSPVYETEPVGGPEQGPYLNLVVELDTPLSPRQLLGVCHRLEAAAGRVRGERWGPRTLDVDILWIDGVEVDEPDLEVPHPRMWERRFVLAPLRELAPELVPDDWEERADGEVRRLGPL